MKLLASLFSLTYLIIIGTAIGVGIIVLLFQMPGPSKTEHEIQIKSGMGTVDIAQMLQDENVIISTYPFMAGAKF